jgi:Cu+-exporting ATPase
VGLVTEQLSAVVGPGGPGVRDLILQIERLGFVASVDEIDANGAEAMEASHLRTVTEWRRLFVFSLCFLLPMLLFQKVLVWIPFFNDFLTTHVIPRVTWQTLIQMTLATPVQFGVGHRFYRAAWRGLQHKNCGMDFLIAMGTTAAYLYSIISVIVACMVESFHGNHFFETSAMLLTFVVMGKLMEAHAKGKTSTALTKLMELQPKEALLMPATWSSNGESSSGDDTIIKNIPLSHVQKNDILKVLPGASIPVDGTVVKGTSSCNEAMITGEAMPVEKGVGATVYSGTVNHNGLLYVRADRVGANMAIAQIVRLVEEAQTSKAPIQMFADRVSGIFAPTVVTLSIGTFIVWMLILSSGFAPDAWVKDAAQSGSNFIFSFLFGVAVLVIACPCALGLATPTAVMVGTGIGAKYGILIKGGAALETAHAVNTVLFDKTGTLTTGMPACTTSLLCSDCGEDGGTSTTSVNLLTNDEMCVLVGCAELNSEHPLSKALVQRARDIVSTCSDFTLREPLDSTIFPGKGMLANVNIHQIFPPDRSAYLKRRQKEVLTRREHANSVSRNGGTGGSSSGGELNIGQQEQLVVEIVVGNRTFMKERDVEGYDHQIVDKMMKEIEEQGNTAVAVGVDGHIVGVLGIADEIKEDALETIEKMHEMGIDVYVVTGDSKRTANAVGRYLQIPQDRIFAEVLPGDKANSVKELQERGRVVAMVGDGINDSPALAQADVGIALGSGAQIAMESAEMVIVKNRLLDVLVAFDLSRVVFQRIRMNFVWAMGYNLIGIPIAAGLLYPFLHVGLPPQFAGLAMAFSSVSVVMSSLHLKYYKTPQERKEARGRENQLWWKCSSLPGQLCACCVEAIFADTKDGRNGSSPPRPTRQGRRRRGQYSKISEKDVEDWGDEGVELV